MKIAVIGLGDIATKAYLPLLSRMAGLNWCFAPATRKNSPRSQENTV